MAKAPAAERFGLCSACTHQKLIRSGRGSEFSMCTIGLRDPDWPKYPRMPVLRCPRYAEAAPDGDGDGAR